MTDIGTAQDVAGRSAGLGILGLAAGAMALFGIGSVAWVMLDSMNPAADAPAPFSIDLRHIAVGDRKTVYWNVTPIFVAHRTAEEVAAATAGDAADMPFPERDADRVIRDEWLVVVGVDSLRPWYRLSGQAADEERGEWGGWRVNWEGIEYDTSGRLRRGPGSGNLVVPSYEFVSETRIDFNWPVVRRR